MRRARRLLTEAQMQNLCHFLDSENDIYSVLKNSPETPRFHLQDYEIQSIQTMATHRNGAGAPTSYKLMVAMMIDLYLAYDPQSSGGKPAWIEQLAATIRRERDKNKPLEEYKKDVDESQREYLANDIVINKLFDFLKANNNMTAEPVEKPAAKKPAAKKTTKKAEADGEEKPAAKKPAAKKTTAKKPAAKAAEEAGEEKPAKKPAAKKTTKKAEDKAE